MLKMSTHIFDIFDNIFQCGIIPSASPQYSMGLAVSPECFNVHPGLGEVSGEGFIQIG